LRIEPSLDKDDAPTFSFSKPSSPPSHYWSVSFKDGISTVFFPYVRNLSNKDSPVADVGYKIMAKVAGVITEIGRERGIEVVFTIIPTKELVYSGKVEEDGIEPPQEYLSLVRNEKQRIESLKSKILSFRGARYIDVVRPLQLAALAGESIYPSNGNGHPVSAGYSIIGQAIAIGTTDLFSDAVLDKPGVYGIRYQDEILPYIYNEGVLTRLLDYAHAEKMGFSVNKVDIPVMDDSDYAGKVKVEGAVVIKDINRYMR
jgi:hypothetical protein